MARFVPPHEIGWELLIAAEKKQPHRPQRRTLASKTPLFAWICPRCRDVEYSATTAFGAPMCNGGLPHRAFDSRVTCAV